MLPSSSSPGHQPPQAGNGGANPSGSAKRGRPPMYGKDRMVHTAIVLPRSMLVVLRIRAAAHDKQLSTEIRSILDQAIRAGL